MRRRCLREAQKNPSADAGGLHFDSIHFGYLSRPRRGELKGISFLTLPVERIKPYAPVQSEHCCMLEACALILARQPAMPQALLKHCSGGIPPRPLLEPDPASQRRRIRVNRRIIARASRCTHRSMLSIERLYSKARTSLNVYDPDISNVYDMTVLGA
jgi:hypothetical protein